MSPRVWRAAGRRFGPWKNGGGETAEILSHPEGAEIDGFDWRISTARITRSGAFSTFAGVSRCFTVLSGGPVILCIDGRADRSISPGDPPCHFPGAAPCSARLGGPPVLALNVMTRRGYRCDLAALPSPDGPAAVARYLLALRDLPDRGMAALDLADITSEDPAGIPDTLVISITR